MGRIVPSRQRRGWVPIVGVAGTVVVIAVAVAVWAFVGQDPQSSPGGSGTAASGPTAPEFTLQTLEGESFTLADHRGQVVVVEFLAPGCPSCTVDLAGLAKATEQRPGVTLLVADVSGADPGQLRDYYRGDLGVVAEVLIAPDSDYQVTQAYEATALGDTVVITPEGTVSWKGRWAGDEGQLFAQIDQAARS